MNEPLAIVEILERSTQGQTRPFLCRCDDGQIYYAWIDKPPHVYDYSDNLRSCSWPGFYPVSTDGWVKSLKA